MISKSTVFIGLSMLSALAATAQSGYNLIGASANQTHFKNEDVSSNSDSFLGFSVNYLHGFRMLENTPLYLETGGSMKFMFYSENFKRTNSEYEESGQRTQMVTFVAPVNLAYKFNIGEDFSITPFAGIDVKAHLSGWKTTYKKNNDGCQEESINLFNDDANNMNGNVWTRFQTGWNAGLRLSYRHVFLLGSYGTDFAKLSNHHSNMITTQNITLSIGYQF